MRTHRAFAELQPWRDPELLRALVTVDALTVVRIEPVSRAREPAVILDLHFAAGERHVTVPFVLVDVAMLLVREADPLVFPHPTATAIGDDACAQLIAALRSELEPRAFRDDRWAEEVIVRRDDPLFTRARARGWYAAAPLATSLPRIAPAVYGRRLVAGHTVVAYGPDAYENAAFVRHVARRWAAQGGDPDASAYFGVSATPGEGPFEVALGSGVPPESAADASVIRTDGLGELIVPVAAPLPANVLVSFDPGDGPVVRTFGVTARREPPLRPHPPAAMAPPIGGSAGRIALVLRPDAAEIPDADVDEARALASGLAAEGFAVTLATRLVDVEAFAPDLVHLFGVRDGVHAAATARWASEAGIPLAVHAYHEAPAAGGYWGAMVTRYCFAYSADDRSVTDYLGLLAQRQVEVDGVGAAMRYAPAAVGLDEAETVLREAAIVFVQSERERAAVAAVRPTGPTIVVPAVPAAYPEPEPVGALVGSDPYVLVHAPLESAGNQLLVARAAARLGVPIVLAGPVADPAYAELVREFAGDGVRLIAEPTLGQAATLYRSAAVVADVGWMGRGHSRILEAARSGGAPVLATSRWADLAIPDRWRVDAADVESVARGIGEAWDAVAQRDSAVAEAAGAATAEGSRAVHAIVAGYAKIATAG
jgi:hypothetical protein